MAEHSAPANGFDAYTPAEIARRVEQVGVAKAHLPFHRLITLAVLAGAFIGLGGVYFLTVTTDIQGGYGGGQFLGGVAFSLGLVLVVVAGAELFTGNNLLVMALVSRRIPLRLLLRNWLLVFAGNLVGALSLGLLVYWAQYHAGAGGGVGARALAVAAAKTALPFWVIFWRGVLANALVCLAVWLTQAARSVTDKIVAILLPISAFVAAGFEHSVANMFFIPYGLLLKREATVVAAAGLPPEKLASLTGTGFLHNLAPATLGNVVGGAVLVGLVYWVSYIWDGDEGARKPGRAA